MEPKKQLKKHTLIDSTRDWVINGVNYSQGDLVSRITEAANQIHRTTRRGGANIVFVGEAAGRLFDEAMEGYSNDRWADLPEIDMGQLRLEGDTYIQDMYITPNRSAQNITVDFNILPSGGEFYSGGTQQHTDISFITGSTGTHIFSG